MFHAIAAGELLIDFTQSGTQPDGYPMLCAHPGADASAKSGIGKYAHRRIKPI